MRIKGIILIIGLLLFVVGCATTQTETAPAEAPAAVEPAAPMETMEQQPEPEVAPEPVMEESPAVEQEKRDFEMQQRKGM